MNLSPQRLISSMIHNALEKKRFDREILDEFPAYFSKASILSDAGYGFVGRDTEQMMMLLDFPLHMN